MKRLTTGTCLAGLLFLAGGCTMRKAPNILIVVIDALRPDRLGVYGSQRGLTPFIDSLGERGYVFQHAYAQASWTNASIASMFTSRYQSQHRIVSFQSVLRDTELTLSTVLRQHGYATGAFSANFLLRGDLGFARGFDRYQTFSRADPYTDRKYMKERAERINRESLAWLDERLRDRHPPPPSSCTCTTWSHTTRTIHPTRSWTACSMAARART